MSIMSLVAIPVAFVVMPVIAVMIVTMVTPSITPRIANSEAMAVVEIETERGTVAIHAGPIGPVAIPLVFVPAAAHPEEELAVPSAIIDRTAEPDAVVIDRAIEDGIIPELVGTSPAVAITARAQRETDSGPNAQSKTEAGGAGL